MREYLCKCYNSNHLFSAGSDLTATPTVVTSGGNLRQKQIYHLKHFYEPRELRKAMISSLSLADEDQMKSIVIPVFDCSKYRRVSFKTIF